MKVFIACEYSGRVREEFRKLGHDAWSCDLLESEDKSPYHIVGDCLSLLGDGWDLMIAHPPCTRLANSGVRWLHERDLWSELDEAVAFYLALRNAPIKKKCLENPVMHKYARERLGEVPRHMVQPWLFGDPTFKATGYELHGLPELVPTDKLTPPPVGTEEHKAWSWIHRCPPGPERWKIRSRTPHGIAKAMAMQWGVE